MKPAKFKAFLFPKPYSDGKFPIYIRIYQNRKSSYVSIGHSISAGHGMKTMMKPGSNAQLTPN